MIPVKQTLLYKTGEVMGNCFAACIASILECDINEIPQPTIDHMDCWWSEYFPLVVDWLNNRGCTLLEFSVSEQAPLRWFSPDKDVFVVASGKSSRIPGYQHSVVWNLSKNELAHDPHPENTGLSEVQVVTFVVKVLS